MARPVKPERLATIALAAALACLGGCSSYWPLSEDLERRIAAEATLEPSIADDDAVRAFATAAFRGTLDEAIAFELPVAPVLADYVRLALERNPGIQTMVRQLEALGMQVPQVTSLDDPLLAVVPPIGDMAETAAGQMDASVGLSQSVPFPAKLAARGRIAEQIVRIALENLRATRLDTVKRVRHAYFAYYLAHASIAVTRENQTLVGHIRDVARAKLEAGLAPQQDVSRAEVHLYELSNALLMLEQQRRSAVARLNALMDRAVTAELPAPVAFDPRQTSWRLDALLARAAEANPALQALRQKVGRDLEAVHLAGLAYWPDFSAGASYSFVGGGISPIATGDDFWNLSLGLRLPVWLHRIRAGILEKNASAVASALEYRSRRNDVYSAIEDALARVEARHQSAVLFRDAILPKAAQAVAESESSYQAASADFLAWIDNWTRLLGLTLEYHQVIASLEQDIATLDELVGGGLDGREAPTAPASIDGGAQPQEREVPR